MRATTCRVCGQTGYHTPRTNHPGREHDCHPFQPQEATIKPKPARTAWGQRRQHRKAGHAISAWLDHGSVPFWTCSCGIEWRSS